MELGIASDAALSLRDIAGRQHISLDYLEQIVPALKSAGLIKAKYICEVCIRNVCLIVCFHRNSPFSLYLQWAIPYLG